MSSSAFMEMRPVYHEMSSRYRTSQPPNEDILYDSSRNVPKTIPEEITAQYPSESMRRSAKRIRSRAVNFCFSSPSVPSEPSPPPLPSLPDADSESPSSPLPPSRPPTRRRTSRAGVRGATTAWRCVR